MYSLNPGTCLTILTNPNKGTNSGEQERPKMTSSKDLTPFWYDEGHRRILSLVANFEADDGFGSVVTRLST